MKKEIEAFTGLRGVAALYVTIYHWSRYNNDVLDRLPFGLSTLVRHGYLSVDLFFILSGFVITLSSLKLFTGGSRGNAYLIFMKRRFARVYPIYIIVTLIAFLLPTELHPVKSLVLNAALVQVVTKTVYIVAPSWSLSAEWFAYLLFPVLLWLAYLKKSTVWSALCILVSFGVIYYVSVTLNLFFNHGQEDYPISGPLDKFRGLAALARCFAEYIIGIILYKLYDAYKDRYAHYFHYAALPCLLLLLVALLIPGADVVIVALLMVLIFSLCTDRGPVARVLSSKPLYFLGEISFSLYLVHTVLLQLQLMLYRELSNRQWAHAEALSYTFFALTVMSVAYLTHRFIELPSSKWVKAMLNIEHKSQVKYQV